MEENKPNRSLFDSLSALVSYSDFRFLCSEHLMKKYLKAIQSLAMLSGISSQQGSPSVASGRDCTEKDVGIHLKNRSVMKSGIDLIERGESNSEAMSNARNFFVPMELHNHQFFSLRERTPREFRSNSLNGRIHSLQIEKSPISNLDCSPTTFRSFTGTSKTSFEIPKHDIPMPHISANHLTRCLDGDPDSMDVFPASKQLWLGSLGPDAS